MISVAVKSQTTLTGNSSSQQETSEQVLLRKQEGGTSSLEIFRDPGGYVRGRVRRLGRMQEVPVLGTPRTVELARVPVARHFLANAAVKTLPYGIEVRLKLLGGLPPRTVSLGELMAIVPPDRPSPYEYALLSSAAYKSIEAHEVAQGLRQGPVANPVRLPEGWKVLQISDDRWDSYFGAAYQNESMKHIVIAHRGTNPSDLGDLLTDAEGIVANRRTGHQEYAWEFTQEVIKNFENEGYAFSCTGHSLGAWLAQVCVLYGKGTFNAVTFDDPGCKEMLEKRKEECVRYERVRIEDLDIVNYLSRPNPINTFNHHEGTSYRVSSELLENLSLTSPVTYTQQAHSLDNIIACFDPETGMPRAQQFVEQFPLFGRSFLDALKESSSVSLLQRFGTFFTGTLGNLIREGRGRYANYDPQDLHRRNFSSLIRRFLTDKKIPPPEELPSHPALSKEQMGALLETLLQSYRVKLNGTIEITDERLTALDFRRALTFLLSGPSLEETKSSPEAFIAERKDPSTFSAQKLLQGLKSRTPNDKLSSELELSRRFEQYKGELQGNLTEIHLAREDLLELAYHAVNGAHTYVFIWAMDALIGSLEEDPCTPERAHSMIRIYSALYRKMGEVMVSLAVRDPAMDMLTAERLTRAFAIALKRMHIYRLKGFISHQFREGEGAIKKEAILEEVRKLRALTEDKWEGKDITNSVWKCTIRYLTHEENVEMPSGDNWEVKHNLNSIAEGVKFLRMDETDFKTAGKEAWGLTKKTLLTGKKLVELFSSSAIKEIPSALCSFVSTAGWGTFLTLGKAILSNADHVVDAVKSTAELMGEGYTTARDTFNNFSNPENWYLKTLSLLDSTISSDENVFLIAWLGAPVGESADEKRWDWHYERIAFLRYIITHTTQENMTYEMAIGALRSYYIPTVWQTLSEEVKVKLLVIGKEFSRIGELQQLLEGIKHSAEYNRIERKVGITEQFLRLQDSHNYWKARKTERRNGMKPSICEYISPVETFTGRKTLLKQIKQALRKSTTRRPTAVVLSGLGGVGKTQLATKFIEHYTHLYNLIWTFEAESTETLNQSYHAFAKKLKLVHEEEKGVDVREIRERVHGYLQNPEHHGWLLYFDNVEDPKGLERLFPPYGGRVLITARQSREWAKSTVIPVDEFTAEEAIEFLEKLIPQGKRDRDSVRELSQVLGCFPLALSQAGSYIRNNAGALTTRRYLDYFPKNRQRLLAREGASEYYHETIATTWKVTMDLVREKFRDAAEILNICAYLHADGIPLSWLKNWLKDKRRISDDFELDDEFSKVIGALRNFALLREEVPLKTLRIHRLVQLVTQDGLNAEEKKEFLQKAGEIVCKQFEKDKQEEGLPHAISITNHALALEKDGHLETSDLTQTASLLHKIGEYLNGKENASEAKGYLEDALRIKRIVYRDTNPSVVVLTLIQVAKVCRVLREYEKAKEHLEEALAMDSKNVDALFNLGMVYYDWCQFQKAKEYYEKALEMKKSFLGESHPSVADTLHNLGTAWSDLGENKKAIEYYEKALEILKSFLGESHPSVAETLNNLGTAWSDLGENKKAIEYYEKALEILKSFLGESHPSVAETLNNLGTAWSDLGENKKAIEYYEKALEMKKSFLGESHPSVASTLHNLGTAWSDLGENKKAIEYYEKALEMKKSFLGESRPSVAETLNNLGTAWSSLGEKKKAIEYYEKALEMKKSFLGESHPSVASTLHNLGTAWSDLGEKKKAIEYYEKSLEMKKSFLGESHPSVADTLHNLGNAWSSLGEKKKAIEYYEKALEMKKSFLGESHPSVADTLNNLGNAWSDLGEKKKAIEYYEKWLEIYKAFYPDDHTKGLSRNNFYTCGRIV